MQFSAPNGNISYTTCPATSQAKSARVHLTNPFPLLSSSRHYRPHGCSLPARLPPSLPARQRLRFLAITARNLDEFFCKRVGALKRQQAAGVVNLIGRHTSSRSILWTPSHTLDVVARWVGAWVGG